MSRSLNVTELNQLDAMMDRTGASAVVSAMGTLASIVASEWPPLHPMRVVWEQQAAQLNGAADRINMIRGIEHG